ncbi:hypothetical protein OH807_35115 [Kitasatospora sp. NBC_01560]|uniref:hypothetical protein n=1 Tax=Kitasatospora sp. NBC_01560 TaxID=2975965 RepID=UPI00386E8BBF
MRRYWASWFEQVLPGLSALACGWGLGPCPPSPPAGAGMFAEPGRLHRPGLSSALPGRPSAGSGPPAAHPECAAGHVPPSEAERALWAQLADIAG